MVFGPRGGWDWAQALARRALLLGVSCSVLASAVGAVAILLASARGLAATETPVQQCAAQVGVRDLPRVQCCGSQQVCAYDYEGRAVQE